MATPIRLTRDDIIDQAVLMGCHPAVIQAVCDVESSGGGFLPDGRPKILFERHLFHRFTGGIYDEENPDISNPSSGGYGASGAYQYVRMNKAAALDRPAALRATSWGMFQCLGDNFEMLKYASVEAMVSDFYIGERQHLVGFRLFCDAAHCLVFLKSDPPNFPAFAKIYNGPNYAASGYHTKMEAAYNKRLKEDWTRSGVTPPPAILNPPPDRIDIRVEGIKQIQTGLALLNLYDGEIDGKRGRLTNDALNAVLNGKY